MATRYLITVLLVVVGKAMAIQQAETGIVNDMKAAVKFIETSVVAIINILKAVFELLATDITDIISQIRNPPSNQNSSIQYLLYTPESPNKTCYIEPNMKALRRCPFNPAYPMKFLIHGFRESLDNNSLYWQIKDRMLELYQYNVIVVNWTSYDQFPYIVACMNTVTIGSDVSEFIQFLQNSTGIEATSIHLIGRSLGAHMAGVAGRQTSNLQRITGLDPAGPLYYPFEFFPRLTYMDATFVDVIHTSNDTTGFGIPAPIGDIDFYPNGGGIQPQCPTLGENSSVVDVVGVGSCNHKAALEYFLESVNTTECVFLSTMCNNYTSFLEGFCSNNSLPVAEMGLPAQPILGLNPKSKFYLQTLKHEPYCIKYDITLSKNNKTA